MKKKISFKCISNCTFKSNYCITIYHKGKLYIMAVLMI